MYFKIIFQLKPGGSTENLSAVKLVLYHIWILGQVMTKNKLGGQKAMIDWITAKQFVTSLILTHHGWG